MLLKFVEKQCTDSKGQYIRYDVINVENKFRIGYFERDFAFENDKYYRYKPEELIELADFIKTKIEENNVKIVKRGKSPEEIVWKATCYSCKSELEAIRNELQVEWDQREGGELGRADCPVCKKGIIFYPCVDDLPKDIR